MKKYDCFDKPVQVRWYDDGFYETGIAFGTNIICSCCGGVVPIANVYKMADEDNVQGIFVYKSWVDLNEIIVGGDFEDEYEAGFFKE